MVKTNLCPYPARVGTNFSGHNRFPASRGNLSPEARGIDSQTPGFWFPDPRVLIHSFCSFSVKNNQHERYDSNPRALGFDSPGSAGESKHRTQGIKTPGLGNQNPGLWELSHIVSSNWCLRRAPPIGGSNNLHLDHVLKGLKSFSLNQHPNF